MVRGEWLRVSVTEKGEEGGRRGEEVPLILAINCGALTIHKGGENNTSKIGRILNLVKLK